MWPVHVFSVLGLTGLGTALATPAADARPGPRRCGQADGPWCSVSAGYGLDRIERSGPRVGGNRWRTAGGIREECSSMLRNVLTQAPYASDARPSHWNDRGMHEIGSGGMSALTRSISLNREVVALDQDRLGREGQLVRREGLIDVRVRPLAAGAHAVAIENPPRAAGNLRPNPPALGPPGPSRARDLWRHDDPGLFRRSTWRGLRRTES